MPAYGSIVSFIDRRISFVNLPFPSFGHIQVSILRLHLLQIGLFSSHFIRFSLQVKHPAVDLVFLCFFFFSTGVAESLPSFTFASTSPITFPIEDFSRASFLTSIIQKTSFYSLLSDVACNSYMFRLNCQKTFYTIVL